MSKLNTDSHVRNFIIPEASSIAKTEEIESFFMARMDSKLMARQGFRIYMLINLKRVGKEQVKA